MKVCGVSLGSSKTDLSMIEERYRFEKKLKILAFSGRANVIYHAFAMDDSIRRGEFLELSRPDTKKTSMPHHRFICPLSRQTALLKFRKVQNIGGLGCGS